MNKKTYTFIMTTNRKGRSRHLTISHSWLKTWGALAFIACLVVGAGLIDYVGLLLTTTEMKRLKVENAQLKQQFDIVESKIESLESSLERVKNFSTKLKLITNIDESDRSVKLAVGPMPKPGQSVDFYNEEVANREPSSEFLTRDERFLQKSPLDSARGELSRLTNNKYSSLSIRIDRAVKDTALREQGILELWGTLSERQSLLNATPSIKPVRGWYTSRFGYRIDPFLGKPMMHSGLDIAAPPGTPVYSPADGVVSYVGYESGYGKLVTVDHGYGVKTRFAHNSRVFVQVGQKVSRLDVISAVGSTGRSSGPHLHYEVRVNGLPVDPVNYILND